MATSIIKSSNYVGIINDGFVKSAVIRNQIPDQGRLMQIDVTTSGNYRVVLQASTSGLALVTNKSGGWETIWNFSK